MNERYSLASVLPSNIYASEVHEPEKFWMTLIYYMAQVIIDYNFVGIDQVLLIKLSPFLSFNVFWSFDYAQNAATKVGNFKSH